MGIQAVSPIPRNINICGIKKKGWSSVELLLHLWPRFAPSISSSTFGNSGLQVTEVFTMPDVQASLGSVLVVGGCGFLGHRIVRQLLDLHCTSSLSVLDIKTDRARLPTVVYFNADISSLEQVEEIIRQIRPDVLIHTASPAAFSHDLGFFEKINVGGTGNLLKAAQKSNTVKAFIYTSSASVVHDSVSDMVDADETFPLLYLPVQRSEYSHTKALAEDLVLQANRRNSKMVTISLRPSGLFGEDDPTTVRPMVEAAASGKYRFQIGNGKNLFDWTYVGNAAQAHIQAAQALLEAYQQPPSAISKDSRVDGEAFIITNDEPVPFWDFARSLGAAAGYPTKKESVRVIPRTIGLIIAAIAEWVVWIISLGYTKSSMTLSGIKYSTMNRTFRIDKAKKRLKYKPQVDMAEATRRAGGSFSKKTQ